jgi:hypothetical protein
MDAPQPAPDPAKERKQLIIGLVVIVLLFAVFITGFTLLIMKGGRGNYYDDIMQRDIRRSAGQ